MDNFLNQNIAQASSLLEKGNLYRALGIFDMLSKKYPNNSEVFHLKAYAHMKSNNLTLSLNNFEQALKLSPQDCNITLDYCNLLNTIGKKELALVKLKNIIDNHKVDYRVFFLQGCIEMNQQLYQKAIESFKKVLELKIDHKDSSFNLGVIYFETKKYDIAEKVFNIYTNTFGNDLDVERYLLQIYLITDRHEKADKLLHVLCNKYPNDSLLWYERARLFTKLKKNNSAIDCYKKCLHISPDFNDGFKNMALLLKKENLLNTYLENLIKNKDNNFNNYTRLTNIAQCLLIEGKGDKALNNIEEALRIHPEKGTANKDYLNTVVIKGTIYDALEKYDKAINVYKEVLQLDDTIFQAYSNIGDSLVKSKKEKESIKYFEKCLKINPNYAIGYLNLGNAYFKLGEVEKSLRYFNKASKLDPNNSYILSSKAAAMIETDDELNALKVLKKAIGLDSFNATAYLNLGIIFKNQNLFDQALNMFDACISSCKHSSYKNKLIASAYSNKGLCYLSLNKYDKLKENFLEAFKFDENRDLVSGFIYYSKLYCADWENLEEYKRISLDKIEKGYRASSPFCSFSLTDDPSIQLEVAKMHCGFENKENTLPYVKNNYINHLKHKKPRIAYLSYDFHDHATMHLMVGIFENQNHDKFDYYAFSYSDKSVEGSEVFKRVKKSFNKFFFVRDKSDKEICKILKDNEIDLAIDLKGHTYKTRIGILSSRPCPIQVTYLGHPGTTAANYIDYAIVDDFVITKSNEKYFSENIIKLPSCYQPNDNKRYYPESKFTKKDLGLPEDHFIFCSFNSPYKIQPEMFKIWMEVLNENKKSCLWLLENENSESTENIYKYAKSFGINSNRIFFLKRCNMNEYLEKMKCADLFLDTFPITAHTTASDALWTGLPIITYAGKSMVSRVAGSILKSIGMEELITYSYEDYKKIALKISNDEKYFNQIKNKINRNRLNCDLFNTSKYTKELEKAYHSLFVKFIESFNSK